MDINKTIAEMMKDMSEDDVKAAVNKAIAAERIRREAEAEAKKKASAASERDNVAQLRRIAANTMSGYMKAAMPKIFGDIDNLADQIEEAFIETEEEFNRTRTMFDIIMDALEDEDKDSSKETEDDDVIANFLRHLS